MERTKFLVHVSVGFEADSYETAGEVLDAIDRKVGKALDGRGHHEITGFETRPCKARSFRRAMRVDEGVDEGVEMVAMSQPQAG